MRPCNPSGLSVPVLDDGANFNLHLSWPRPSGNSGCQIVPHATFVQRLAVTDVAGRFTDSSRFTDILFINCNIFYKNSLCVKGVGEINECKAHRYAGKSLNKEDCDNNKKLINQMLVTHRMA